MKVLIFDADGQTLRLRPGSKPVAGSKGGYLRASFNLNGEYDDAEMVVASFGTSSGNDEVAVELDESNMCLVPDEVTGYHVFSTWLTCKTVDGSVFQTNRARVQQRR